MPTSDRRNHDKLLSRFQAIIVRKGITPRAVGLFREIVHERFMSNPRDLPWRRTRDPYRILVSEIMLQQTQVARVIEKYKVFIGRFPDFSSLDEAPLREILKVWLGLGYNRRAMALKEIARIVVNSFHGRLPRAEEDLRKLPGVGKYTAAAISVFAFGKPALFIETNIRRLYIHFFFGDQDNVRDADIMPLIEKTLDASNPRQWYYALMDYGVMLKTISENPNRRSAHYERQSPFKGSDRQLRGRILKTIIAESKISETAIIRRLSEQPERVRAIIARLENERFIQKKGEKLIIR
ncbi:MAG TPA: hypothetical protein VEI96_10040 [Thermodesulfovibrionales bacterium]|nr:hypothetical protein [Thermodesulfovibrionales bacterium]